jgi:hypothetical protein
MFVLVFLASGAALAQTALPPLTTAARFKWATASTVGAPNLAGGLFSSGWNTLFNHPKEYGPHWEGFGKRYGMRLTGGGASNAMEAGLASLWGEDPRYHRVGSVENFGRRLKNTMKQGFLARNRSGKTMPAYARYAAIPGANFLSNAWRPDSDSQASDALVRTGLGFAARITANIFTEFWPDVSKRALRRN